MKIFVLAIIVFSSFGPCVMDVQAETPEIEKAKQHGARGQATFRVIDSTGKPVEKAKVGAGFNPYKRDGISEGMTDTNGLCSVAGISDSQMRYTITKEGFYTTESTYWFYPGLGRSVADGRWQPWNPTTTVVLKEHRKPIAMYAKKVDVSILVCDVPVGFDLEVGDWVAPHGQGSKADMFFTYRAEIKDYWTGKKELIIACSNRMDGFLRSQKDMWSGLSSAYDAPADDYLPSMNLILDATKDKVLKSEKISRTEYLVFRVRTVLDDKGKIVSVNYGKIYGPIEYGAGEKLDRLRFTYYFNPTVNDRNLEFDPSRNLLGATDKRRVYQP